MENNTFNHLTLEERRIILIGIKNGSTKTAIAKTLGKDKSTIGKEIKLRRGGCVQRKINGYCRTS